MVCGQRHGLWTAAKTQTQSLGGLLYHFEGGEALLDVINIYLLVVPGSQAGNFGVTSSQLSGTLGEVGGWACPLAY